MSSTDPAWERHPLAFLHHRWFHLWAMTAGVALALLISWEIEENPTVVPAILLFGALSGTVAFGAFVSDRLLLRGVVPFETIAAVILYGGGVGVLFGGMFDILLINDTTSWEIFLVGPIEELAKLVVPVALWLVGRHRSPRAGLVLGLASAAGFAILETMGYGFTALTEADGDVTRAALVPIQRGLFAPFGHMVWTGTVCIVAWSEWQRIGHFRLSKNVVATLVIVMGLHSINDFVSFESGVIGLLFLLTPVIPVISYLFFKHRARELTPPEQVSNVPPGWRPRRSDPQLAADGSDVAWTP